MKYSALVTPNSLVSQTIIGMLDMLSSTLARAAWPGAFTAMVLAEARNSARQVLSPAAVQTKLSQLAARSPSIPRPHDERDVKATHRRRRRALRPVVQAYRVWSKRRQISRRHAVRFQSTSYTYMEEVAPAPLEEVFLMEEILPAPLQEVEAPSPAHTRAMHSLRLPVLSCNVGCGHPDPRPDHPSLLPMSAFRHGFNASSYALNLNTGAPDPWRYVGGPFQSFDLDACATRPTLHCQPEALVLEFGAEDEDATVPDAFVGGGESSGDEIEFIL